jgi:hypothetical protein
VKERKNTRNTIIRALANRRLQPLGHVSAQEIQYIAAAPLATKGELITK